MGVRPPSSMGRIEMVVRRVPRPRAPRTQVKAFVAGLAILAAAILVGMAGTAAAAGTALSVDVRLSGADSVSVSGRTATASATVRFDRRSGLGWVLVKRTRAHAHRYATSLSVAPGTSATFRVTSN